MNKFKFKFKTENDFNKRVKSSSLVMARYKDRIPVIVQLTKSSRLPSDILNQIKYLVPKDNAFQSFQILIRRRVEIRNKIKNLASEGLFFFTENGHLPIQTQTMSQIYEQYKDEDGFLYIYIDTLETFG
jgi:GABA(A) receptor-associated protein